jgi:hypothetical protein
VTEGFCKVCGKVLRGNDMIAWECFGLICGECFLPLAGYVLQNMEGLEALVRAHQNAPGIFGEA